jgi:hypothetical protein
MGFVVKLFNNIKEFAKGRVIMFFVAKKDVMDVMILEYYQYCHRAGIDRSTILHKISEISWCSDKWQTLRKLGTQSHGSNAVLHARR